MRLQAMSSSSESRSWAGRLVRVGYGAKGVLYLLIGVLALRMALGRGGRITDAEGALRTILREPFGVALLVLISVGLVAYALWEVTRNLLFSNSRSWPKRALAVVKALIYGSLGVQAARLVFTGTSGRGGNADSYARSAMQLPFGELLLAAVGAGIAVYGFLQIRKALHSNITEDFDLGRARREAGSWVLYVSRAGVSARGVIFIVVGAAFVRAALDANPREASGMREALWTLFSHEQGTLVLAAVALGLTCYGVWQLLHMRYARV